MKKRQGSALIMVIVTMVVLTAMLIIITQIQQVGATQTSFVAQYNKARYAAMSGSQITIGALYKRQQTNVETSPIASELHDFFAQQANSGIVRDTRIETNITVADGLTARIIMVGQFDGDAREDNYTITIRSMVPVAQGQQTLVHETRINLKNPTIKSEKIFME